MRLINVDMIDTQLVKDEAVVFLLLGEQVLEALLALGFLLLQVFDDVAMCAAGVRGGAVAQQLVVRRDLLPQEALLVVARHADALEGAVGGEDAIPRTARDLGGEELAPVTSE